MKTVDLQRRDKVGGWSDSEEENLDTDIKM